MSHPSGEVFVIDPQGGGDGGGGKGGCAECVHTHTRIVARSPWGYGKVCLLLLLNISVYYLYYVQCENVAFALLTFVALGLRVQELELDGGAG